MLLQSHHQSMCQHKHHRSLHHPKPHTYASMFTATCLLYVHLASAAPATPAPVDSLYFSPYLMPGQLPNMTLLPLYQATWRIAGHELNQDNFAAAVKNLTQTMFAAYSFHAQLDDLQPSQPALTRLDGRLVDEAVLAEDTFSNTVLQDYDSVTARFNVSIDSSAWFPDVAAAVNATHNQFVDAMEPLGFSVASCTTETYQLEAEALPVLQRMPIRGYTSYRATIRVSGVNLIPFTLQKQNLATARLSSLLASAEVWQLQCSEVNQTSPQPEVGAANISTADLTYVLQQRTAAPYVGEELLKIMNDSTPFFSMAMSSEGLPTSADLQSITVLPGESVTDQIASYNAAETPTSKFAGLVTGVIVAFVVAAAVVGLVWLRRQVRHRRTSHKGEGLAGVELQSSPADKLPGASSDFELLPANEPRSTQSGA